MKKIKIIKFNGDYISYNVHIGMTAIVVGEEGDNYLVRFDKKINGFAISQFDKNCKQYLYVKKSDCEVIENG